jgi:chromosome segregation ATPase
MPMLDRIKGVFDGGKVVEEVMAKLDASQQKLNDQQLAIDRLVKAVSDLTDAISTSKSYQEELHATYKVGTENAEKLKNELASNLVNVQVLRSQLQNTIAIKISEELKAFTSSFKEKFDDITRLQQQSAAISQDLAKLREEINRLAALGSNIKQADLQLTNYAKQLEANDREKLNMMKEIDTLQRLVGSMRRQQPNS